MPRLTRVLPVVLALLAGAPAVALDLDPGGFSVDFTGAGRTAVTGDELVTNGGMEAVGADGLPAGWQTDAYVWLPVDDPVARPAMLARLRPLMRWSASTDGPDEGRRVARLAIPDSAYDPGEPQGGEYCAIFHQTIVLPPLTRATRYLLRFRARGRSTASIPNSRPYVRITFYDQPDPSHAGQPRVYAQNIFAPSDRWHDGELEFVAPPATRSLDLRLAVTGGGEISFDRVSLRRTERQEQGVSVRLMPGAYLDNRYHLATGSAASMIFGFRKAMDATVDHPRLVLELPEFVEVLDTVPSLPAEVAPGEPGMKTWRWDLTPLKGRIHDESFAYPYNQWDGFLLLLRTAQPAGERRYAAHYRLEDGAERGEPLSFALQVDPPLPTVQGPRQFRSGTHLFLVPALTRPEAVQAFVDVYRQVGLNAVHVSRGPLAEALGRQGIERYAQPFANGYTFGDAQPGNKPDDAVFRDADGQPVWEAVCPVEVYREGPYFRETIVGKLLRPLLTGARQAEQIMCNWEPFMYHGRGCFCPRCKAEFVTWSKLAAPEVDRVWPKQVIATFGDRWYRFRSWQHGRLMATLERAVQAVGREGGLGAHFIPEVHYALLTSAWPKWAGFEEYAAVDYLKDLPVLEPWSPYNWFVFGRGPYEPVRGLHLNIHASASEVQAFTAAQRAGLPPAKLIAFPFGTFEGATQPEALTCELTTFFLDGYHGAFAYLFPGGYDARYWRALAELNRQLAAAEPWVTAGERLTRHTVEPATPLPSPDPRFLQNCGTIDHADRWAKLSLLQSWEFARGTSRLIAVGNYWEQGECFFRLKPEGMPPGRYVLREPLTGRVHTDAAGRVARDAAELARGVLLHAGAMRFTWLLLEPYRDGTDDGRPVTPQAMAAAREARLAAITRAAQAAE